MDRNRALRTWRTVVSATCVAGVTVTTQLAHAGTTTLVRPVQSVLDMILGLITVVATLALILGVLGQIFAAQLPSAAGAWVSKLTILGMAGQIPNLVSMAFAGGALIP